MTDAQGRVLKYTKGAPQIIIDLCTLDSDSKTTVEQAFADLAAKGMRALGVAESTDDDKSWRFLGILSMQDPPRDDSKGALRAPCRNMQKRLIFHVAKLISCRFRCGSYITTSYGVANLGWHGLS